MAEPEQSNERHEPPEVPLRGLRIMRIAGIDVFVNRTWLIIFALVTWSLAEGYFPAVLPHQGPGIHWGLGALAAVLLFACVLAHELTHSLIAIRKGLHISGITLFLFGGVSNLAEAPKDPGAEFQIAISGPMSSFALAVFFYGLYLAVPGPAALLAVLGYLVIVNALLGIFNIIPGFPLDGGRALRAILWWKTENLKRSTLMATTAGVVVGWLIVLLGLARFAFGDPIGGVWFVVVGLFLKSAATYSAERAERGEDV
ncbi:MAG: site-2 protease family protein [Pseudomonadota bacterium]